MLIDDRCGWNARRLGRARRGRTTAGRIVYQRQMASEIDAYLAMPTASGKLPAQFVQAGQVKAQQCQSNTSCVQQRPARTQPDWRQPHKAEPVDSAPMRRYDRPRALVTTCRPGTPTTSRPVRELMAASKAKMPHRAVSNAVGRPVRGTWLRHSCHNPSKHEAHRWPPNCQSGNSVIQHQDLCPWN